MGTVDLERRTVTAIVYAVVVLAALVAPSPIFPILIAVLAVLGYIELRGLFRYRSYQPWGIGAFFTLAFVAAHVFRVNQTYKMGLPELFLILPLSTTALLIAAIFGVVVVVALLRQAARGRPVPGVLGALFALAGAAYIGLGLGFLIDLWSEGAGGTRGWLGDLPVWLLVALLATWLGDSTAYLVGARLGRAKIVPRISPGKTWEGTLAGFGAAAAVALVIGVSAGMRTGPVLLLAALVGPVGFAGDLFESGIKRVAGAKDSGSLFPGHGGVLDRVDSLLFVAPAVALVMSLAAS